MVLRVSFALLAVAATVSAQIGNGAYPGASTVNPWGVDPNGNIGDGAYPGGSTPRTGFPYYTPQTFPDSLSDPAACKMRGRSLVCDPNEILSSGNITANHELIDDAADAVREQTDCKCAPSDANLGVCKGEGGFTVSVALVDQMILDSNQHGKLDRIKAAQKFAETLRVNLDRGQCGDDAVVFLSRQDRTMWTAVGEVTKRYLTAELITSVTLNAEKFFYKDDWTGGLNYTLDTYRRLLRQEQVDLAEPAGWYWPIPLWAVIVIGVVVGLLLLAAIGGAIYGCVKCCCQKNRRDQYTMGTRM